MLNHCLFKRSTLSKAKITMRWEVSEQMVTKHVKCNVSVCIWSALMYCFIVYVIMSQLLWVVQIGTKKSQSLIMSHVLFQSVSLSQVSQLLWVVLSNSNRWSPLQHKATRYWVENFTISLRFKPGSATSQLTYCTINSWGDFYCTSLVQDQSQRTTNYFY